MAVIMAPPHVSKAFGIEVKITDRCDQHCFHCVNEDGQSGEDLDCSWLIRRLHEWKQREQVCGFIVREVRMTGGEPLMNIPALIRIVRTCRELGIKSGINTNGMRLDSKMGSMLKQAGLSLMKVSYDAADEGILRQIRGNRASLSNLEKNLSMITSLGFELIVRFSLCRHNADQLPHVYQKARLFRASRLQIKPLISSGRAQHSNAFLTREEIYKTLENLVSRTGADGKFLQILCWPPEDCAGLPGKLCGSINKIYVSPNGDTAICNYVSRTKPLGNLIEERLEDIFSRHTAALTENSCGHIFVEGCPQASFFESPG
jgi:MoaA/NifB/PqqE/SkfB family radical SAM enzyme